MAKQWWCCNSNCSDRREKVAHTTHTMSHGQQCHVWLISEIPKGRKQSGPSRLVWGGRPVPINAYRDPVKNPPGFSSWKVAAQSHRASDFSSHLQSNGRAGRPSWDTLPLCSTTFVSIATRLLSLHSHVAWWARSRLTRCSVIPYYKCKSLCMAIQVSAVLAFIFWVCLLVMPLIGLAWIEDGFTSLDLCWGCQTG
jgi:hypothetical protein